MARLPREQEVKATQSSPLGKGTRGLVLHGGKSCLPEVGFYGKKMEERRRKVLLIPSAKASHRNLLSAQRQPAAQLGTDLLS